MSNDYGPHMLEHLGRMRKDAGTDEAASGLGTPRQGRSLKSRDGLDRSESIKLLQRDWTGRSTSARRSIS